MLCLCLSNMCDMFSLLSPDPVRHLNINRPTDVLKSWYERETGIIHVNAGTCEWLWALSPRGLLGVSELQWLWQLRIREMCCMFQSAHPTVSSLHLQINLSLSLSLSQMTRPIQVKPADSESRGGNDISLPPHFIFSLYHFLFQLFSVRDISFDLHTAHCCWSTKSIWCVYKLTFFKRVLKQITVDKYCVFLVA